MNYRATDKPCKRCAGKKGFDHYMHVGGGHCFACLGTGFQEQPKYWYGLTQIALNGDMTKKIVKAYDMEDAKVRANDVHGEVLTVKKITRKIVDDFVRKYDQTYKTFKKTVIQ